MSDPVTPAAPAPTAITAPAAAPAAPAAAAAAPAAGATALTAPADVAAPVAAAPVAGDITFKLPDDFKVAPEAMGKYTAAFKEAGLDSPKAQKLADVWVEQTRAQVAADRAASEKAWATEQETLKAAAKADLEIGGANWSASVQSAQKALLKVGNPKLNALLDSSGLGNHPEVIRAFAKLGKLLGEDSITAAGSGTGGTEQTAAQALAQRYPQMAKAGLIKA